VTGPPANRSKPAQTGQIGPQPGRALCVYCRRQPVEPRFRPFCSERCRLQDLARWVDGDYRVAGEPVAGDAISPEASDVDDD
jgi:endogenous inhibitor of DNA gyrase (YacG/DUF329 family)